MFPIYIRFCDNFQEGLFTEKKLFTPQGDPSNVVKLLRNTMLDGKYYQPTGEFVSSESGFEYLITLHSKR